MNTPTKILALAVAYYLTGKAGLALAIPPGYATAIFPASGVALAALLLWGWRLWPGVFLGSLGINLWISLTVGEIPTQTAIAVSVGIGSGAALQALFGAWLIRRYVGFPTSLADEREVFRFLLFGGVISCLVNASMGVSTLWLSGAVSGENFLFSWWTWWVGDALGILLGAPLMLIFFGNPKPLWRARRWSVAVPMAVATLVIIPTFLGSSHWEAQRAALEFRKQAALLSQTLESSIRRNLDALHAQRYFTKGVDKLNFKGFNHVAEGLLSRHPSLQAISYNPRVSAAERATFETSIRQEVDPNFVIKENSPQGGLVPAGIRQEYITVAYIQPLAANRNALGFDVASNPDRKSALDMARDQGTLVATGRIELAQDSRKHSGLLVFLPVYASQSIPATLEERRAQLQGYIVGVFGVDDLLASALEGTDQGEISAKLFDVGNNEGPPTFLAGYGDGQGMWEQDSPTDTRLHKTDPWSTQNFNFGERQWRLELSPSAAAQAAQRSLGSWFVLAGGLLFASLLGAFLLIMTGRTARIEELVRSRTSQLSDRESRLSAILEHAGDGIITINQQGIIESANPAAAHLLGYGLQEMTGCNMNMMFSTPNAENGESLVNILLETERNSTANFHREVEGIHKDTSTIPLDLTLSEVKLVDRVIYTGILHDLTERKRADKLKNEFVSTVSHELRTPLTSIYAGLKLVLSGAVGEPLPRKSHSLIKLAYRNCARLNLLINDILDMQKIESGRIELQFKPLDATELVQRVIDENSAYAKKLGVRYVMVEPVPEALILNGDEGRLCQVLSNLLSNAAKFTQPGDNIEIRIEQSDPWVKFSITDHGPGIPEEFQSMVFDKFSQADSSDTRQSGGTGLGLSITKALVESHHGEIGFNTKQGEGTTFFFLLPMLQRDIE